MSKPSKASSEYESRFAITDEPHVRCMSNFEGFPKQIRVHKTKLPIIFKLIDTQGYWLLDEMTDADAVTARPPLTHCTMATAVEHSPM